jgi:hypothetical protein
MIRKKLLLIIIVFSFLLQGCVASEKSTLPAGKELAFNTISKEQYDAYRENSPRIFIVTANQTIPDNNPWIKNEEVIKLNSIDYSKYFAIIAFNGFLGYRRSDFEINKIIQDKNIINVVSHFSTISATTIPANSSESHIVTVSKESLIQYGEITFKLLDESGQEKAKAIREIYIASQYPSKTPILPTEYLKDPLNGAVVKSDCIVSGNVTAQRYETVTNTAYTIFTLSVDKMIKGDSNLKELYIKVPGGLFNDGIHSPVFAGPTGVYFRVGDKVLITLHKEMDNIFVPEYGPKTTGGSFPIDNPTNAIIWIKGTNVSTQGTLDQAIGRVIQIMQANQIPIALPPNQWPPLPVGPVTRPAK